jgi:hypothetical protein
VDAPHLVSTRNSTSPTAGSPSLEREGMGQVFESLLGQLRGLSVGE